MSAVVTDIHDLEFVWRAAGDGFAAGVDFKVWLANSVIQQRADLQAAQERIAEQARQLDEAREIIDGMVSAVTIDSKENNSISGFTGARLSDARAWLAANPAPEAGAQP